MIVHGHKIKSLSAHAQGETLERIELLFSKPWLERVNLVYYLR